jgi:hypothetical protein
MAGWWSGWMPTRHVALAAEFVASHGLDQVEFVLADARDTGIESGSFDLWGA